MKVAALPIGLLIGTAIIETGSRGGLLALGAGWWRWCSRAGGDLKVRLRNGLVTALALGILTYAAFTATVMKNRLEATAETGTLAGREQLWPSLVEMALEKPWAGWGPINNQYEVAARTTDMAARASRRPQSLARADDGAGLAGTIPFLMGPRDLRRRGMAGAHQPVRHRALRAGRAVPRRQHQHEPAAYKPFWWVLAVALASGSLAAPKEGRRPCAV